MAADGEINGSATILLVRLDEQMKAMKAAHMEVREKLDELSYAVSGIPALTEAVKDMKPEVEKAKRDRWMRLGVVVGGAGGAAGIASAVKAFILGATH